MGESGIYQIRNLTNGKVYLGSTVNLQRRWSEHKTKLQKNKHANRHLQFAWNKYGEESFVFEVLEYCMKSEYLKREQYWLDQLKPYKNGYNICSTAIGGDTFSLNPRKEEIRKKFGKIRKGVILGLTYEEVYGSEKAKRIKKKMSDSRKGKSSWNKGIPQSEESKIKNINSHLGCKNNFYGKHHTEETKDKIRKAKLKRES